MQASWGGNEGNGYMLHKKEIPYNKSKAEAYYLVVSLLLNTAIIGIL